MVAWSVGNLAIVILRHVVVIVVVVIVVVVVIIVHKPELIAHGFEFKL